MVPLPQLADLVAETLQFSNWPLHFSRDVLGADLQETITELAVMQNASKHLIRPAALVVALIPSDSPHINSALWHDALPVKERGVDEFASTPGCAPGRSQQEFRVVTPTEPGVVS